MLNRDDEPTGRFERKTDAARSGVHPSVSGPDARVAVAPAAIVRGMAVVEADGWVLGEVEQMDGADLIELRVDEDGIRHFIPLAWVTRVDRAVHVDRTSEQAMHEWTSDATTA